MNIKLEHNFHLEIEKYGAKQMNSCMQCGNCSAVCPLSTATNTFPRKIYRYIQLGMRDKLLESPEPWLCYYCGECNDDCTQGASPAETMMATRRWLTAQYDWTGLAEKFYLSAKWEIGALLLVALSVITLFLVAHGPIITDRVSVNTFAPVIWIEIGDLVLAIFLFSLLLSNAYRMTRYILGKTSVPKGMFVSEVKTFFIHFLTQKSWRKCGDENHRWLKHFILVSGYLTMLALVMVFIRWFQVDDSSWHFTALFGYYATGTLMFVTGEMLISRLKKKGHAHQYSQLSDWLFLILLFLTALSGIILHIVRLMGLPITTYITYVIHLAIVVPMLVIEVPFGKWAHLFYRPLAIFLSTVKEKAEKENNINIEEISEEIGDVFMTCVQCGTCTSVCPESKVTAYNPRRLLRGIGMHLNTGGGAEQSTWHCTTCNYCGDSCPRGIKVYDLVRMVRGLSIKRGTTPKTLKAPLSYLKNTGTPWKNGHTERIEYHQKTGIQPYQPDFDYAIFDCCSTSHDADKNEVLAPLHKILQKAKVSFGNAGPHENCCADLAYQCGDKPLFTKLSHSNSLLFKQLGIKKLLASSPHCFDTFRRYYEELDNSIEIEHYTQLLDRLIKEKRLVPTKRINKVVTYHDPCYLGRHNGIYEEPRNIINSIPGIDFVEMCCTRQKSLCCGGGGGGMWYNENKELELGQIRVNYAMEMGASMIITACPYCVTMLDQAIKHLGIEGHVVVKDLAEVLAESIEFD